MTPKQDLYGGARRTALLTLLLLCVAGCSPSTPPSPTAPSDSKAPGTQIDMQTDETTTEADRTTSTPTANVGLPRLLDLGAGKCIPCKMMAPILEELKQEYAGVFEVEFIDVWQYPEKAKTYGVETIPTQIFFDASGEEVFRHVGFFSKEDILATWKQVGVEPNESEDPESI